MSFEKSTYRFRKILAYLGIFLLNILCFSYVQGQGLTPVYKSEQYEKREGLTSSHVYRISQDSSKLLWFITQRGISRFDGLKWETFNTPEDFPLNEKSILCPLGTDSMLVAGYHDKRFIIKIFNGKEWSHLPFNNNLEEVSSLYNLHIACEYIDKKIYLAFTTNRFIYSYNPNKNTWNKTKLPSELQFPGSLINNLYISGTKAYISSSNGLYIYSLSSKSMQPEKMLAGQKILAVTSSPTENSTIYVMSPTWLGKIKNGDYCKLVHANTPPDKAGRYYTVDLLADKHNRLFFIQNTELFKYNLRDNKVDTIKLNNAKAILTFNDLFADHQGNVWVATPRGAHKINSFRFSNINEGHGTISNEISTILEIDSVSFLLGSNIGLSYIHKGNITNIPLEHEIGSVSLNRILDAVKLPDGRIFSVANAKGLIQFFPETKKIKEHHLPENRKAISVTYYNDKILVGTELGMIYSFENNSFKEFLNLPLSYIRRMQEIDGLLYISTANGIYELSPSGALKNYATDKTQQLNVYCLLKNNGDILVGTTAGLCILKDGNIIPYQHNELTVTRPIYQMVRDLYDNLWFGTDQGVFVYNGKDLRNYNKQHGLAGQEVNRNAMMVRSDSTLWIGTDEGISIYHPTEDIQEAPIPTIEVLKVQSLKHSAQEDSTSNLNFAYNNNTLEFFFRGISYTLPQETQYRARLVGLDIEWHYIDNYLQRSIRYTNLPPGKYQLEMQARNGDYPWSEITTSQVITVKNPFYKEWWFIAVILLVVVYIGYVASQLITQKRNERKLRQAIAEKKVEIARSENKFKGIWDSVDTGMALINEHGQLINANPAFYRLFNLPSNTSPLIPLNDLVDHPIFSLKQVQTVFKERRNKKTHIFIKTSGSKGIYLSVSFSHFKNAVYHQSMLILGVKDITSLKLTEQKNRKLTEELLKQNKSLQEKEEKLASSNFELHEVVQSLEARNFELDQFVYKTSHDLRAPLASALGLINLIAIENDPDKQKEYLKLIQKSLQKQDNFIRAMLTFSKSTRAENNSELINFEDLIEQCFTDLQFLDGFNKVTKHVEICDPTKIFYSDRMKLYIILSNIISNCIKYRSHSREATLDVVIKVSEDKASIILKDNGIGIQEQYLDKIFNMFYRATSSSDGSGLGLYIVKQTIEKLKGYIQVNSVYGSGTEFIINIPNAEFLHHINGSTSHSVAANRQV